MDLPINLDALSRVGNKERRIVSMCFIEVDRAQKEIGFGRGRKIHDELVTRLVGQDGTGHRAFRPNKQIRTRTRTETRGAQAGKFVEDRLRKFAAEFLFARNVRLHERNAQGFCRPLDAERMHAESHHADDGRHRECEIVMWPHRPHLGLENEAECRAD